MPRRQIGFGRIFCVAASITACLALLLPVGVFAQVRGAPSDTYRTIFSVFYDGNYDDALKWYQQEWRGAIKAGQMRWIDSICYATMMGECYYHMGMLSQALENYTTAVNLYLNYPDWMIRCQFRPIQTGRASQVPWGVSTRGSQLGHYPSRTSMLQGAIDNTARYKDGGLVQQAIMYPVDVQEIMRCTALAIRRRAELLGPLSKYDALNKQLETVLQQPIGPRNHWSQAYADILLAEALLANGKEALAAPLLTRSTVAQGQYDHHLTPTALFELGRIALRQANYPVAAKAFFEATVSAYYYDDYGVLEEAFRHAAQTHLLANKKGVLPALVPAAQWAQAKNWRQLRASFLLSAAEGELCAGQTGRAAALLDEATAVIGRRSMGAGWIGARLNYLRSVAHFQARRLDQGELALSAALKYMRGGSLWLFHIAQVDSAAASGAVTARNAVELYRDVLRDPQPADWAADPLESLAAISVPNPDAMERWFLAALERSDREAGLAMALEVSDRARRRRFFSTLSLGGRLHALRWLLEAPPAALDKKAMVQRQDLLAEFPAYQALQQQAKQVADRLDKLPLAPRDAEAGRLQIALLSELGKISAQQEVVLREMAVRRVPADMLFPPLRPTEEFQKAIPPGTAVLSFFAAGNRLHGFLLNREKGTVWVIKRASALLDKGGLEKLLREMGNYDANREVAVKDLADPQWQKTAQQVLEVLLEGSQVDLSKEFRELVIVPEGMLWYLPFEALQVGVGERIQPLIARVQVRYAPTLSLALPDGRTRRPNPKTALVAGRLYPRETDAAVEASSKEILRAAPEASVFGRGSLPANSALFKTQIGQLIVLDDLVGAEQGPYGWAPIQADRSKPGNTLADWMALPWGGPDVVILPGFHTPAENAGKRISRSAAGADVFLSLCALMSSGVRTVLLSRWRTGGQSAVDLVREFVQELPHSEPADAWQRAVMVVAESPLNLEAEPRIKKSPGDQPPKGNHPFFWAGYMLVDSGSGDATAAKPDKPAPKEPDKPAPKEPGKAEPNQPKKPEPENPQQRKQPGKDEMKPPPAGEMPTPAEPAGPQKSEPGNPGIPGEGKMILPQDSSPTGKTIPEAQPPKSKPPKGRANTTTKKNRPS